MLHMAEGKIDQSSDSDSQEESCRWLALFFGGLRLGNIPRSGFNVLDPLSLGRLEEADIRRLSSLHNKWSQNNT